VLTRASTEDIEGHVQKLMQKDRHRSDQTASAAQPVARGPGYGLSAAIQTSSWCSGGGPAPVHPQNGRCVRSRRRHDRLLHTAAAANHTYSPYLASQIKALEEGLLC